MCDDGRCMEQQQDGEHSPERAKLQGYVGELDSLLMGKKDENLAWVAFLDDRKAGVMAIACHTKDPREAINLADLGRHHLTIQALQTLLSRLLDDDGPGDDDDGPTDPDGGEPPEVRGEGARA